MNWTAALNDVSSALDSKDQIPFQSAFLEFLNHDPPTK